jgi:hypothetical protein
MRFLLPLLMTAGLLAGGWAAGAAISVHLPWNNGFVSGMDVYLTNDDNGAVYNSARTAVVSGLAEEVFALGNSGKTSVEEMLRAEWGTQILPGEIDQGWSATVAGSLIELTNNGSYFLGVPEYEIWRSTNQDPTQDTMALRFTVPNTQLELNATPGYQPFTLGDVMSAEWYPGLYDAVIVRSDDGLLSARNHRSPRPPEWLEQAFVGMEGGALGLNYPTPGRYYVLLRPEDFAAWTSYEQQHGDLPQGGDANGNGRSNFLDYASGQDAAAVGLQEPVELSGETLTLRERINSQDARPTAEFSQDLVEWFDLEEGVHYQVAGESVTGEMRTRVLELPPPVPTTQRFFRLRFE